MVQAGDPGGECRRGRCVRKDFEARRGHGYFPLVPGTGFHYKGVAEDGKTPQRDDMFVTRKKKTILGVKCTVVRDTVSSRGKAVEYTLDWYAEDKTGNVWYLGEDTRDLHHGRFVKADDSGQASIDAAQPGIICPGIRSRAIPTGKSTTRVSRWTRPACSDRAARSPSRTGRTGARCSPWRRPRRLTPASPAEVVRRGRRRRQGAHRERQPRRDRSRQRDALVGVGPCSRAEGAGARASGGHLSAKREAAVLSPSRTERAPSSL